jgi:hypothetical protein
MLRRQEGVAKDDRFVLGEAVAVVAGKDAAQEDTT